MLLAGGQGERLYPLTKRRAKPAVPFGGMYRIIDFTLSNCLNSGLKRIYVLTQHKSLSLDRHLRSTWSILHPELGEFIQTVPPQLQLVSRWYAGTADAVFQNLDLLDEEHPQHVVVLSGDHVYRMDYERLLRFHEERGADLTLACTQVTCRGGPEHGGGRGGRRRPRRRLQREARVPGSDPRAAGALARQHGHLRVPYRGAGAGNHRRRQDVVDARLRPQRHSRHGARRAGVCLRRARALAARGALLAGRRHPRHLLRRQHGAAGARARVRPLWRRLAGPAPRRTDTRRR